MEKAGLDGFKVALSVIRHHETQFLAKRESFESTGERIMAKKILNRGKWSPGGAESDIWLRLLACLRLETQRGLKRG